MAARFPIACSGLVKRRTPIASWCWDRGLAISDRCMSRILSKSKSAEIKILCLYGHRNAHFHSVYSARNGCLKNNYFRLMHSGPIVKGADRSLIADSQGVPALPACHLEYSWPNSHLQYPLSPITKSPIPFHNLIKRKGMRKQWPKINTSSSHRFH